MPPSPPAGMNPLSPAETALYTQQMLESLRKIALRQNQAMLAHLLELAAMEAKAQVDQET